MTVFGKVIRGSVDRANIYLSVIDGATFDSEEEELADLCAAPPVAITAHSARAARLQYPRILFINIIIRMLILGTSLSRLSRDVD